MSSSTLTKYPYTDEDQAKLFRQFASVMKLAQEGQRPASQVSQVLQVVIGGGDIIVVPLARAAPAGKVFHVTGNFRSPQEAIDALDCPVKWGLAETPEKIPLIIQPVDCLVRTARLGGAVKIGALIELFPRIVAPMTLFAFGAEYQEEQQGTPHFTVWLDANGLFWSALISINGDKRHVNVSRRQSDDKCCEDYHILTYEQPPQIPIQSL